MNRIKSAVLFLILITVLLSGCGQVAEREQAPGKGTEAKKGEGLSPSPVEKMPAEERNTYDRVVLGARGEVQRQVM